MSESLMLKWGTIKGWEVRTDRSKEILKKYVSLGASAGAAQQRDTPEQKQLICDLIDAVDCETIYLAWSGEDVSKEAAKAYVMGYDRLAAP